MRKPTILGPIFNKIGANQKEGWQKENKEVNRLLVEQPVLISRQLEFHCKTGWGLPLFSAVFLLFCLFPWTNIPWDAGKGKSGAYG